jgi:nitroimidazol reductase NimA-like FMN-containing flavoprotein (pyridoxamine 5'-phosphate oxidase superfamily)
VDDLSEVKELFKRQNLAVLATHQYDGPHTFLVAFAETEGLRQLLFATHRYTRKYHHIRKNPLVALLVDNRSNHPSDFQNAMAITAKGSAQEITDKERDRYATLYLAKHPNLKDFINLKDTALIRINIEEYKVARFQDVKTLRPA